MKRTALALLLALAPLLSVDAGPGGKRGAAPKGDASTAPVGPERLESLLSLRPIQVQDGAAALAYPLQEPAEVGDFEARGFDKVDLRQVVGNRTTEVGLELGAGSQATGVLRHKLPLGADTTIELDLWAAHAAPSAIVVLGLSDKVGVLWGQQPVRPRTLEPFAKGQPAADPTLFKEERSVHVKLQVTNGLELAVECNGRRTGLHRFTRGELADGRFSIGARNCRLVVTDLKLTTSLDGLR